MSQGGPVVTDSDLREAYERRVRALAELGHRGSATAGERRGAEYLVAELRSIGLAPEVESFTGCHSVGARLLLHVGVAAAGAAMLAAAPVLGAVLGVAALASLIAESVTSRLVLGRFVARGPSANVVARVPPADDEASIRLIVSGHYDTQRSGIVWSGGLWDRLSSLMQRLPTFAQSAFLPVSFAMLFQAVVGLAGGLLLNRASVLAAAGGIMAVYAIYGVLLGECAVRAPVPGAADNASGAAAVLSLAEEWVRRPEVDVELVLMFTGCEETGLLGAAAWADRHRSELAAKTTAFLNLDGLAFGPPRLLKCEVPLAGPPRRYPSALVARCREATAENGRDLPEALTVPGFTDGLAFLARGLPGVTLVGCQPGGRLPHWHRLTDDAAHMSFDTAWDGVLCARRILRRLAQAMRESKPAVSQIQTGALRGAGRIGADGARGR